jgi:hypothetical protein
MDSFFGTLLVIDTVFRLLDLDIRGIPLSVEKIRGPKDKPIPPVFDSLPDNATFSKTSRIKRELVLQNVPKIQTIQPIVTISSFTICDALCRYS